MPNGLRIEHLCDLILKAQSWLVLNLPVFMFGYIYFNVPPTRIAHLVRNVSYEKIWISIWKGDMEQSSFSIFLLFSKFVFSQVEDWHRDELTF